MKSKTTVVSSVAVASLRADLHVGAELDGRADFDQLVEGPGNVFRRKGGAVTPGDVRTGFDRELGVIFVVFVALGQPVGERVREGAVDRQWLIHHLYGQLVVGERQVGIPQQVAFGELALGTTAHRHERVFAWDLSEILCQCRHHICCHDAAEYRCRDSQRCCALEKISAVQPA